MDNVIGRPLDLPYACRWHNRSPPYFPCTMTPDDLADGRRIEANHTIGGDDGSIVAVLIIFFFFFSTDFYKTLGLSSAESLSDPVFSSISSF